MCREIKHKLVRFPSTPNAETLLTASKKNVTLPQVLFKHFANKNELPGLSIKGTLVENGLIIYYIRMGKPSTVDSK